MIPRHNPECEEDHNFGHGPVLWDADPGVCCAAFQLGACPHTESEAGNRDMTKTQNRIENQWDGIDVQSGDWIARWTREDGEFHVYVLLQHSLVWKASFSNPNHGFDLTWQHALEEVSA